MLWQSIPDGIWPFAAPFGRSVAITVFCTYRATCDSEAKRVHLWTVSLFLASESKLPLRSKSSLVAPKVISRRSTRCRTTISGSMIAEADEGGGWPLTPCPGVATSMLEEHELSEDLHEGMA